MEQRCDKNVSLLRGCISVIYAAILIGDSLKNFSNSITVLQYSTHTQVKTGYNFNNYFISDWNNPVIINEFVVKDVQVMVQVMQV